MPARGQLQGEALIGLFISEAERVNVTLVRVDGYAAVPAAVAAFLREANLPAQLKLAPDPLIATIPWASEPLLTCITGAAAAEDTAAVSAAFAGVAETGTLVMVSGPDNPTGLNFLPEAHIVVLPTACIVGCYEDAFAWLRASTKPGDASGAQLDHRSVANRRYRTDTVARRPWTETFAGDAGGW